MAITAIIGGLLAAASLVTKFVPNSDKLIDVLTPYAGWIGVVMFISGVYWTLFGSILNLALLTAAPITWVVITATSVSILVVGFLLGFGLITKYALGKNEAALEKGQRIRAKLIPFQAIFGVICMVAGVLNFIF